MNDRVIDLSEQPAHLNVRNSLLVIRALSPKSETTPAEQLESGLRSDSRDQNELTVPLEDIAVLIASHPQVSFTQAVLSGLATAGAVFVTCNEKHMPVAMMLPLVTHSVQTERFAAQAAVSVPVRKRVWQQIVQAQIRARARLLAERAGKDWGLQAMAARVRSGDPQNHEAQAARIYWRAMFGEDFIRDREAEGLNACLNYGLGVLRAIVARALCGAGLLPTLGLHHHNRYDAFCLADDLMEPFRPVVDRVVVRMRDARGPNPPLDKEAKRAILEGMLGRFSAHDESRTLFDWISQTASSLAGVIEGRDEKLEIPCFETVNPQS